MALDLLGPLPRSDSDNVWVMVVCDYCFKWMEAYLLPDARAETVANKFVSEFVCRLGVPLELHSDQGTNFESAVFAGICPGHLEDSNNGIQPEVRWDGGTF